MRQSKSVIFNEYQRGVARRRGIAPDGKGQGNASLSRATALGNSVRSSARIATRRNFVSARTNPPWRPSGVQFVSDEPPSRGPLSGLSGTLAGISTDHLLSLALHLPLMA